MNPKKSVQRRAGQLRVAKKAATRQRIEGRAAAERAQVARLAERLLVSPYAPPSARRRAARVLGLRLASPALLGDRGAA